MAIALSVVIWKNKLVVRIEKVWGVSREEEERVECRRGSGNFDGEKKWKESVEGK
jgi:hypothetical protein